MPLYRWEIIRRRKPLITRKLHDVSQVLYLPFDKNHEPYSVESYDPTQVLRLPFEDPPQEVTRDRSGSGNDGTIYGATRVIGKVRNALLFDGVDDYVEVADDPSLDITDAITIVMWIKAGVHVDYTDILQKGTTANCSYSITCQAGTSNIGFTVWLDYSTIINVASGSGYLDDRWHFVAITYDRKYVKFYRDGAFDVQHAETEALPVNTNPLLFGKDLIRTKWFKGTLDEVRIYNRALSQSEIKRLMNLWGV